MEASNIYYAVIIFKLFIKNISHIATSFINNTRKRKQLTLAKSCHMNLSPTLEECHVSISLLMYVEWEQCFLGHVDVIQICVGGTLTQMHNRGVEREIFYYSKRL